VFIISSDLEFLHVHPEEIDANWRGGPDISFKTNFPMPGLYKAWGQFQHQGKVFLRDLSEPLLTETYLSLCSDEIKWEN